MSKTEIRTTAGLALLMAMRMLGLFMVLPVFAIYGAELEGATTLLVGVAVGVYGLSQACLQIPFGRLSDSWGRKPVIALGLALFALGSLIAGVSDSIYGVILGRSLQGAGAIASTVMALVGDLIRDEHRTKSMAMVGMSIGISFCLAMILGPALTHYLTLNGLFLLIVALAILGLLICFRLPTPIIRIRNRESLVRTETLGTVFRNPNLRVLNLGIFILHMGMTALFLVIPVLLVQRLGMPVQAHWKVYLPVMLSSFVLMLPLMIIAETKRKVRTVFRGAIMLLAMSLILAGFFIDHAAILLLSMVLYFLAFNLLEAQLPSLVSRFAPAVSKGSAMGLYSTSQFAGAFLGGVLGGWLLGFLSAHALLVLLGLMTMFWWLVSLMMEEPGYAQTKMIYLGRMTRAEGEHLAEQLLGVRGVNEATVMAEEGTAYLKVSRKELAEEELRKFTVMGG